MNPFFKTPGAPKIAHHTTHRFVEEYDANGKFVQHTVEEIPEAREKPKPQSAVSYPETGFKIGENTRRIK